MGDADAGSMCSQAVVHKPCKAAVVRQQAMQRQEEAAQRRREELRVAAQEQFEFKRQQRRQHGDARRITDMDVDASNGVNTVTVRSGAMNCAAEPKDVESTSTGLDHWTPRERGAKASRDVAEAKHGNVLEVLARERQRTHLERKALEQRARNGMTEGLPAVARKNAAADNDASIGGDDNGSQTWVLHQDHPCSEGSAKETHNSLEVSTHIEVD